MGAQWEAFGFAESIKKCGYVHCEDLATRNMVAETIDIKGTCAFIYLYFFLYLFIKWPTSDGLLMYIIYVHKGSHTFAYK